MWIALQDKVLIILSVAAVVSLALGIYQAVGADPVYVNGQKEPRWCLHVTQMIEPNDQMMEQRSNGWKVWPS